MPRIKMYIGDALKSRETRKVCHAFEELDSALSALDDLSFPVLVALRDYVSDEAEDRTGARADFMRAFGVYLDEPLKAAEARDRKHPLGIYRELLPADRPRQP